MSVLNTIFYHSMTTSLVLFYLFAGLGVISSLMVVISKNPVFSVLFLILSFFNLSVLLFLLGLEFLPITFLIVYVGAIAVLFLFVLIMLNIKISELKEGTRHYLPISIFLGFIFFFEIFTIFYFEFTPLGLSGVSVGFLQEFFLLINSSFEFSVWSFKGSNIFIIAEVFFTTYAYLFVLLGFILLLAMMGTIVLTLQKRFTVRSQQIYKQVLRKSHETIVRYKGLQ